MTSQDSETVIHHFVLSLVEEAINKIIGAQQLSLEALAGSALRFRTYGPELNFYVLFDEEGVQLLSYYDGPIDARVRANTSELAQFLFAADTLHEPGRLSVRTIGDRKVLDRVQQLTTQINFWDMVTVQIREWVPGAHIFSDIVETLRVFDPSWVERLQNLPQSLSVIVTQLQQQACIQDQQLAELRAIRQLMASQQRSKRLVFGIGFLSLIFSALLASGAIPITDVNMTVIFSGFFLLLGLGFMLPLIVYLAGRGKADGASVKLPDHLESKLF